MISVLVSAFNAEDTIISCINSVQGQKWQDFEIVIIDDGSKDGTPALIDEMAKQDARIRVIHQANQGISAARNRLILESTGDELMFLDADDRLLPDCLELLHRAKLQTGVSCVCCNHYIVHDGVRYKRFEVPAVLTVLTAQEAIAGMLYHRVPDVSPWGKLYSRELLQKIHFPEGCLFEDSYVIADVLISAGQIAFVPEALYDYVWYDTSISKSRNDMHLWDFYDAVDHMTHVAEQAYPEVKNGCVRRRAHAVLSVMRTLDSKLHKSEWKKASRLLRQTAWTVLMDNEAPKRDKLGILATLPGHWCYQLLWKLYTNNRNAFS